MDIRTLENIIDCALSQTEDTRKAEATQFLDDLRRNPDQWSIGLSLFYESEGQISKFFGLSLVREYMSVLCKSNLTNQKSCHAIREAMMSWTRQAISMLNSNIPNYIINNVVSILTLCLKRDYPENWPDAFADILKLSCWHPQALEVSVYTPEEVVGADYITRIILELDTEVVIFNEQRTREEVAHNMIIKDAMRECGIINSIVDFLCKSVSCARNSTAGSDISVRCLDILSTLIGWIDINIVTYSALPTIYIAFQDTTLAAAACKCVYEIVKKGMDPMQKVQLIHSINLLHLLVSVPNHDLEFLARYGSLVDMLLLELLAFWSKFEDTAVVVEGNLNLGDSKIMVDLVPIVIVMLKTSMDLIFQLFGHSEMEVHMTVLPSLHKFVSLLKQQYSQQKKILEYISSSGNSNAETNYFVASEYLNNLLVIIFKQLQFPLDYKFDENDEEEVEIDEVKKDIKKLFVNCSRIFPVPCLELISAVFSSMAQPFSTVPFPVLEAALKLVHCFSESGPQNSLYFSEGIFPSLVNALHQTDLALHAHSQIVLSYYEVSSRYIKIVDQGTLQKIVGQMLGSQGLRHSNEEVRYRTTYLFLKIVESLDGKSSVLLPVIGTLSDLVLYELGRSSILNPTSELHLLDAIGIITSSSYSLTPELRQKQLQLLSDMIRVIMGQIDSVLSNPLLSRYMEELAEVISHKVNSFSNLARGHHYKERPESIELFGQASQAVVNSLQVLGAAQIVRNKSLMFAHRMIKCMGSQSMEVIHSIFGLLLTHSDLKDTEDVVQLLNQSILEYDAGSMSLIDSYLGKVINKFLTLFETFNALYPCGDGIIEAPHVETERASLQRQYLGFIYHVCTNSTVLLLSKPQQSIFLQGIFENIRFGLQGGRGKICTQLQIPIRKSAVGILVGLVKAWGNTIANKSEVSDISAELRQAFYSFLYDQAIPLILGSCTDRVSINLKDAATQGLLVEIASLLWTMHSLNPIETISYFRQLLVALGWPEEPARTFITLLSNANMPVGTFKDSFKQFIRSLMS